MKKFTALYLLFACAPSFAQAAASFYYLELEGSINPGSASYVTENLQAAERTGAQGLILQLNTPGGLLSSTREIIQGISESKLPVIVYVAPGGASATSAGALITLASHVAVMAPGTNIGAAHPVGSQGEDVKGVMGEKVTNDTAALARSQATLRGRNSENAEAVVTKSKSFTAEEAVKAGLVDFVATDIATLLASLDGRKVKIAGSSVTLASASLSTESLMRQEMSAKQKFLHIIANPSITAILMTLGGIALYAEISSGFAMVVPGILGLFCFLLAFTSMQMLPINVGGVLLFLLGFALLVAEVFVTSFGLLTLGGLAAVFLGGLFLIDPASTAMRIPLSLLLSLVASIALIAGLIGWMLLRERRSLSAPALDPVIGAQARVESVEAGGLRGTALVQGEIWSFAAEEALQPGEIALVQSAKGLLLQLKRRT